MERSRPQGAVAPYPVRCILDCPQRETRDMTVRPVPAGPSSQLSSVAQQETTDGRPYDREGTERAVAALLTHGVLNDTFGYQGEYEVRTTLTTCRTWQYRCVASHHGQAITKGFSPILIKGPRYRPHARLERAHLHALRHHFATEAVQVHVTRCAALREYALLASIYAHPSSPAPRRRSATLGMVIGAALLTTYGLWKLAPWTDGGPPSGRPLASILEVVQPAGRPSSGREAEHPMGDRPPAEPPVSAPRPASSGAIRRDLLAGQARAPDIASLVRAPKDLRLIDLLALEDPTERADHAPRVPPPEESPTPTTFDIQAGELVRFTGWIQRVFRDPDSAYRLLVSPTQEARAPSLSAVVPPPDQAAGPPGVRVQLQAVRTFIRQQLLQQREPSPRGSVMRRPIFMQLTGQVSVPDLSRHESSQGHGPRDATARWAMHPVLDIQFATPAGPSDRARVAGDPW